MTPDVGAAHVLAALWMCFREFFLCDNPFSSWCKGGGEGWIGRSARPAFSSWCPLFLLIPPKNMKKIKSEIIDECSDVFIA